MSFMNNIYITLNTLYQYYYKPGMIFLMCICIKLMIYHEFNMNIYNMKKMLVYSVHTLCVNSTVLSRCTALRGDGVHRFDPQRTHERCGSATWNVCHLAMHSLIENFHLMNFIYCVTYIFHLVKYIYEAIHKIHQIKFLYEFIHNFRTFNIMYEKHVFRRVLHSDAIEFCNSVTERLTVKFYKYSACNDWNSVLNKSNFRSTLFAAPIKVVLDL